MKLSDLKAGDIVQVDGGFTCMAAGPKTVMLCDSGDFYVECEGGRHYLEGQEADDGELIGIAKAEGATP